MRKAWRRRIERGGEGMGEEAVGDGTGATEGTTAGRPLSLGGHPGCALP
jgi:hypothetical protein